MKKIYTFEESFKAYTKFWYDVHSIYLSATNSEITCQFEEDIKSYIDSNYDSFIPTWSLSPLYSEIVACNKIIKNIIKVVDPKTLTDEVYDGKNFVNELEYFTDTDYQNKIAVDLYDSIFDCDGFIRKSEDNYTQNFIDVLTIFCYVDELIQGWGVYLIGESDFQEAVDRVYEKCNGLYHVAIYQIVNDLTYLEHERLNGRDQALVEMEKYEDLRPIAMCHMLDYATGNGIYGEKDKYYYNTME